jgi:hypothetical protein
MYHDQTKDDAGSDGLLISSCQMAHGTYRGYNNILYKMMWLKYLRSNRHSEMMKTSLLGFLKNGAPSL